MELLIHLGFFSLFAVLGFWRGRRNERKHLQWLKEQEEQLADVLVFATRYPPPPGQMPSGPMDPVMLSGSVVVASDFFRMLVASLRKVVGGNYLAHERLLERARRHAVIKLKQQARERGIRMVFNMRLHSARISDPRAGQATQVEVLAWGTGFVPARGTVAQSHVHHQPSLHITADEPENLLNNPASRIWVLCWFVAVAYVLGELLTDSLWVHSWRYLHGAPWLAFVLVALLIAALLVHNGRRNQLSWYSSIALAALTLPLLPFVFYFAGLRINGNLAMKTEPTRFVVQADRTMQPIDGDGEMPAWKINPDLVFWETILRPGTEESVLVVRGPLGFYQYDITPWRERQRLWRESQPR